MIESLISKLAESLPKLSADKLASVEQAATLTFNEHFAYQSVQSRSFATGRITLEVSQWLYATLGGSAEHFNRQPLPDRVACIQVIGLLL